jgi:hypothetical protein
MIPNNNKTSLRVPSQLPEFIRDDINYDTFVSFMQAYYEWMELANTSNSQITTTNSSYQGVTTGIKNLTNYFDVDQTIDDFISYFVNDFLPYFPESSLSDKRKILKIAKQIYQSKGTPASYDLLFRLLYNSPADIQETKDLVFRPSDGNWYVPKLLKVKSDNDYWLIFNSSNTKQLNKNLRVFGLISKTFASVEDVFQNGNKFDVYISDIERLFQSGETVKIVDIKNQDVLYFNGEAVVVNTNGNYITSEGLTITINTPGASLIEGKLVGAVSYITINPMNRGTSYNIGDPVVVYGGLSTPFGIGANAYVSSITTGSLQSVTLTGGGFGYRKGNTSTAFTNAYPSLLQGVLINGLYDNTQIITTPNPNKGTIIQAINFVDNDPTVNSSIINLANNIISLKANASNVTIGSANYYFENRAQANANSRMVDVFTFDSFSTYPLASVELEASSTGYTQVPSIAAYSEYYSLEDGQPQDLSRMGILAPPQLVSAGIGYKNGDPVYIDGGTGYGAAANVTTNTAGSIVSVEMVPYANGTYTLGGQGYMIEDVLGTSLAPLIVTVASSIQTGTKTGNFEYAEPLYQGSSIAANTFTASLVAYDSANNLMKIAYPQGTLQSGVLLHGNTSGASINVTSTTITGTGGQIVIPGILGSGASFISTNNRIGSVTTIGISDAGEDYISTPSVSLRVQDLCVTGISDQSVLDSIPKGLQIFQGEDIDSDNDSLDVDSAPYQAYIDSVQLLVSGDTISDSIYNVRVYNYYGTPKLFDSNDPANTTIWMDTEGEEYPSMYLTNVLDSSYETINGIQQFYGRNNNLYTNGVINYGDGTAKGTARFLNGLIEGQGQYLDTKGQPSGYSLVQSENINDYTYNLSVEVPISQYRDTLKRLLHPAGMNVIGVELLNNEKSFHITHESTLANNLPLYYFSNTANVSISTDFTNTATNIVTFSGISANTLANTVQVGQRFGLTRQYGMPIYNKVSSVDYTNTKIQLYTSLHLTYSNVATGYLVSGSNTINIKSVGNNYTLLMGGWDLGTYYSTDAANNENILIDMVFPNDKILFNNKVYTVSSVYYANNADNIVDTTRITLANNVSEFTSNIGNTAYPLTLSINRNVVNENNVIIYTIN